MEIKEMEGKIDERRLRRLYGAANKNNRANA